jgi:hypothetical protein
MRLSLGESSKRVLFDPSSQQVKSPPAVSQRTSANTRKVPNDMTPFEW